LPSTDESYVFYVFSQLERLQTDSSYNIKAFGVPDWLNYESIDLNYFNSLNVHFTSSYWVASEQHRTERFRKAYLRQYNTEPSRFIYQGYDIFAFLGKICLNYGGYHEYGFKNITDRGICMDFQVNPVTVKDTIQRYENRKLQFLQFKDFSIQPIQTSH
jgi:hypothetical protein